MKKKSKILLGAVVIFLVAVFGIVVSFLGEDKEKTDDDKQLSAIEEANKVPNDGKASDVYKGKYDNLIFHDFNTHFDDVKELYKLEILYDKSFEDRTCVQDFELMNNLIDEFFMEDIDKSYVVADVSLANGTISQINYNNLEGEYADEKHSSSRVEWFFGNDTQNGGYMIQIDKRLINVWFSRNAFGNIGPLESEENMKVYSYLSCVRQCEDMEINLKDGKIKLSEMEKKVLSFVNEDFPMEISDNISFGIADARVFANGEYDGICFKLRRIYKGVPFEYGSSGCVGMYIDKLGSDTGQVAYEVSTYPDTMLAFGQVSGTVVEKEKITGIISVTDALDNLSKKIGDNSVYDVYGIELVYRECKVPEEQKKEIDDILEPKWKFITINQNDSKYTLFYVDVITGEITERFEYYYE